MANKNELALITGASSGIGFELARLFARDGYDLVLVSEKSDELARAAAELRKEGSGAMETIVADLSRLDGAPRVFEEVNRRGRPLDVLVNNAGVGVYGDFAETSLDAEIAMINLNVIAYVQLTKLFGRQMAQRGSGRILNTASVASVMPTPLLTVYGATKAFVLAFTESVREEFRESGVSVTALMPGPTDTQFFERAGAENSKIVDEAGDPAIVAKAGYEALMAGKDKVITPFKAKVMARMSELTPDPIAAKQSHKKHAPKDTRDEERA